MARAGTAASPRRLNLQFERAQPLRYGENPHQEAAFYRDLQPAPGSLGAYRQRQGKELSYNNIADADAAWECVRSFPEPACVIVKHANPCGAARAGSLAEAYGKAFATDPTSAFGGIIAFNRELDAATAQAVTRQFVEVVIAPAISTEAARVLADKANIRVLEVPPGPGANDYDFKRVGGGLLVQTPDTDSVDAGGLRVVTRTRPSEAQTADLMFAWRITRFVKSNAIVFCGGGRTLGVGAGQMSRVDAARIAAIKAGNAGHTLQGSVVASDAFFPFRDGVDVVAQAGARAIVQPGGSLRDDETTDHSMDVVGGNQYALMGACDNDCTDVDLKIFDQSGALLMQDIAVDDTPVLLFTANGSGRYRVQVIMATCNRSPCYYGVQLMAR